MTVRTESTIAAAVGAVRPFRSAAGEAPPEISLAVGFTTFPGEIFQDPRSPVEKAYRNPRSKACTHPHPRPTR